MTTGNSYASKSSILKQDPWCHFHLAAVYSHTWGPHERHVLYICLLEERGMRHYRTELHYCICILFAAFVSPHNCLKCSKLSVDLLHHVHNTITNLYQSDPSFAPTTNALVVSA